MTMLKRAFEKSSLQGYINPSEAERRAHAVLVSVVIALLMGVTAVGTFIFYQITDTPPSGMEVLVGLALVAGVSAWLSSRGRVRQGVWLLVLGQIILPVIYMADIVPGQGVTLALISIVQIVGLTVGALSTRGALLAFVLGVIQAAVFLVYDNYAPHTYIERNYIVTAIIVSLFALGYVFANRRLLSRSTLRVRFTMAFLFVALVPLVVLSALNTQRLSNDKRTEARTRLSTAANAVQGVVDTFVQQTLDAVRTEARLPELVGVVQGAAQETGLAEQVLRSLALKDPVFISSYALLDVKGRDILDTNPSKEGLSEAERQYFRLSLQSGRPFVSTVMFYDDLPRIYFTAPIRNAVGDVVGVLRVEYNAAVLQWLVMSAYESDQSGGYVVLLDNDNYMRVAHSSRPNLIYKTYTSLTDEQAANLQKQHRLPTGRAADISLGQNDVIEGLRNLSNSPYFTSYGVAVDEDTLSTAVPVRLAPWVVLTRTPVRLVETAISEQTRSSILLSILITVLVIAFATLIVGYLTRPIGQLTQVARQVADGNLDVQAPEQSRDEIGLLGRTFNQMTGQLKETLGGLEQRVKDRTRALELSGDVSRRLSRILDTQQLVSEVVELLQFAFNYYHVHIYLWDKSGEYLNMVGGTGEAGKAMLENHHRIGRGRGLVGQACETGTEVVVQNTAADSSWLPNPLLPDTRSEIAVPILLGDDVLGAIDVQQNVTNGVTEQDADLLRGIANQLAIALRNAQQVEQAQQRAQRDVRLREIIEQVERTQSVPEALQVAARELGRGLNVARIQARLHVGENGGDKVSLPDQERQS